MKVYLSAENECKYWAKTITKEDIFEELISNGFNIKENNIPIESVRLTDLEYEGKGLISCGVGAFDKDGVYMEVGLNGE